MVGVLTLPILPAIGLRLVKTMPSAVSAQNHERVSELYRIELASACAIYGRALVVSFCHATTA